MARQLVILGASGNALDLLDIVEATGEWKVLGFLDDGKTVGSECMSLPVIGGLAKAREFAADTWFINAIGSDRTFRRKKEFLEKTGLSTERFATLVHPLAGVSSRAKLEADVSVAYGASVAGRVEIRGHVTIGPRAVVGHDSVIGAYSVIAPGALISGSVNVGEACYIGAGSMIRQGVKIGDGALVGMGAVVLKDVAAGTTVVGNPVRVLAK